MARYAKSDASERRTASLRLQLTPSERAQLEQGAAKKGTHLSQYVRELCLRRAGGSPVVAGTKRDPLTRDFVFQMMALGNNLNQLARIANTTKAVPHLLDLKITTDCIKAALKSVIQP
jgi:uncharacterized protein (DUF1778 family)